jgi:soluble lytic murein transglycosylase-like protein
MSFKPLLLACSIALCMTSWSARSEEPPPTYVSVSQQAGIPSELLYAVAKTESNTQLNIGFYPWPWTLNVAGKPMRFNTQEQACDAAVKAIDQSGAKSVDIGLGQLNWGYNGRNYFRHPCDSLNPLQNLQVAARLLRTHYDATGDWIEAAGRYHRPAGGAPAEKYRNLIRKRLAKDR